MTKLTSADYAPQAPPATPLPATPTHERDEPLLKTMAIDAGLGLLVTAFIVLLAAAAFVAVFVVLSAFAPS